MRSNSEVTSEPRRLWTGSGTDGSTWDEIREIRDQYGNFSNGKTMEKCMMKQCQATPTNQSKPKALPADLVTAQRRMALLQAAERG